MGMKADFSEYVLFVNQINYVENHKAYFFLLNVKFYSEL